MSVMQPFKRDRIILSPKRGLSISLWPPRESRRPEFDFSRASISVQEYKIENGGKINYGESLRLPCSEKSLLLARIIEDFSVEGRKMNREYQEQDVTIEKTEDVIPHETNIDQRKLDNKQLKEIILNEFKGQTVIVRSIISTLQDMGHEIQGRDVASTLRELETEGFVKSEERTAKAGHTYTIWIISS